MSRKFNNPVVLIHGFSDIPGLTGSWTTVEEVLRNEAGLPTSDILTVQIPPLNTLEERTKSAISAIDAKFSGKTVHLIAHSMGGLNARDIAARSGTNELKFKVLTVTTFGTPHHGVKAIEKPGFIDAAVKIFGIAAPALIDMKPSFVAQFSERRPVNPAVKYFTWAGECAVPTLLFGATFPITSLDGATDCLINVSSAQWDKQYCTQLGVFKGADHLTILNKEATRYTIPHLQAAEDGKEAPVEAISESAVATRLKGDLQTALSPMKGFIGNFRK